MPTLVDLTEQELAELKDLTRQEDITAAIRSAMTEYLRFARRQRLKELSGHVQMEENWQAQEAAELRCQNGNAGPGPN